MCARVARQALLRGRSTSPLGALRETHHASAASSDGVRMFPASKSRSIQQHCSDHMDFDAKGNICSITIEHASVRADAPKFSFEKVAA